MADLLTAEFWAKYGPLLLEGTWLSLSKNCFVM